MKLVRVEQPAIQLILILLVELILIFHLQMFLSKTLMAVELAEKKLKRQFITQMQLLVSAEQVETHMMMVKDSMQDIPIILSLLNLMMI